MEVPDVPLVFPKLSTAVTGPFDAVALSTETVDWEVEIAVVIGTPARHVPEGRAWEIVAGLTVGQDLSDRDIQRRPQSAPPVQPRQVAGRLCAARPVLVTPAEFADRLESWIEGVGSMSHTFVAGVQLASERVWN